MEEQHISRAVEDCQGRTLNCAVTSRQSYHIYRQASFSICSSPIGFFEQCSFSSIDELSAGYEGIFPASPHCPTIETFEGTAFDVSLESLKASKLLASLPCPLLGCGKCRYPARSARLILTASSFPRSHSCMSKTGHVAFCTSSRRQTDTLEGGSLPLLIPQLCDRE